LRTGRFHSFDGRIDRRKFWLVQIPLFAAIWVFLQEIDPLLARWFPYSVFEGLAVALLLATPLVWLQCLIAVKRCHDRGKSGFWALLLLVPIVGQIWLLIDCGLMPSRESDSTASRTGLSGGRG
jgi:uncharacterized membrane protein YhaH (DUF805 family)